MHPTAVANAAWVLADAPSKVPFYVAGVLLVAWAVLLAVTGITHPDFPGSRSRGRLVMLTSAALVLTTITTAVVTGSGPEETRATAPSPAAALELRADPNGLPAFDKHSLDAAAGKVTIRFDNPSPAAHNVTIAAAGKDVAASKTITGATTSVSADLKPGSYTFYCSVDAHRQLGMHGTLAVR